MIKLVASDMDGTLLDRSGKVSATNLAAIKALEQKNIRFLVCTGRNYVDAVEPLKEAEISCDIICMNGAAVFDGGGKQIRKQPLLLSQINHILTICRPYSVLFDFMSDEGSYTTVSREEFKKSFENNTFLPMVTEEHTFDRIVERFHFTTEEFLLQSEMTIYKISVIHEDTNKLKQIRFLLENVEGISIASSAPTNLEITHKRAQKGTALLEYAVNNKIRPREILAVGDSENDLSMLELPLGYTIAMENASSIVKSSARLITRSNQEHGVAYAIHSLILTDSAVG